MLLLDQFSSLWRFHRTGVLPFGVPVTPLNLTPHPCIISQTAGEAVEQCEPRYTPLIHSACYWLPKSHTAFDCHPLPLAVQPISSPPNGSLIQPTFPSFQVRMPWKRVTKALLNSRHITTTTICLSTQLFPGITEGNQGGEAQFSLCWLFQIIFLSLEKDLMTTCSMILPLTEARLTDYSSLNPLPCLF